MTTATTLKRTPLYEEHLKLGAKMVSFGGWEMPIQYTNLIEEHKAVRNKVGMFDAGHMGVVKIIETKDFEKKYTQFLTRITNDLDQGRIRYNRIIDKSKNSGVVDDILVYRDFENYLAVFNASNVDVDIEFFKKFSITAELMGLHIIAVQGPEAEKIVQDLTEDNLADIKYYGFAAIELADKDVIISRTGYTGERGFEIMVSPENCAEIWNILLQKGVTPCGLGARDTLRIEAGMPLYGHELKLDWTSDHSDTIVGLKMLEKGGVPRQGYKVLDNGKVIGEITSGTFSPTLEEPIAMAIAAGKAVGDLVQVEIRGKSVQAKVVELPFVSRVRKK